MGNNVYPVETLKEAYKLAAESPGTVLTDITVYEPQKIGLAKDSKVLLLNGVAVKGRYAAAEESSANRAQKHNNIRSRFVM